jgi:hypothetical protein
MHLGAVVALVRVPGAVNVETGQVVGRLLEAHVQLARQSPWTSGPWAWLIEDVRALIGPVLCRGAQGLWRLPDEVFERVAEAPIAQRRSA